MFKMSPSDDSKNSNLKITVLEAKCISYKNQELYFITHVSKILDERRLLYKPNIEEKQI